MPRSASAFVGGAGRREGGFWDNHILLQPRIGASTMPPAVPISTMSREESNLRHPLFIVLSSTIHFNCADTASQLPEIRSQLMAISIA
jgi:hypothetical protein